MNRPQQKTLLLLLTSSLLLSGCFENRRDTDKLCANNPALKCEELNTDDGQCKITRTDLIWHRQEVLKSPTDLNKITEYHLTQKYQICLEVAAQIQAIDQTELKQRRFNALVNAGKNLERISTELAEYHTPEALYFLWSQNNDAGARREFLQMEGSSQLETARLQYALATFYIDRDHNKTVTLLNHALELSHDPKTLNLEIIQSLASVNQFLHYKERAYIWAMVAKSFDIPIIEEGAFARLYPFNEEKLDQLNQISEQVTDSINNGQYRANLIPNYIK
jgi:hypothetical protein